MKDNKFKIEIVWKRVTPELSQKIKEFWESEGALPDSSVGATRVNQVLAVCYDNKTGDIIGVSTALKMAVPRLLNNVVYYYRHFVAEAFRKNNIGTDMIVASRSYLNDCFVNGEDKSAKGLFTVTESKILQKARRQGVSPAGTFMGVNKKGEHLRIAWFDGAKIAD